MSVEYTIRCDWCGNIAATSRKGPADARRWVTAAGGVVSLPEAKDMCDLCRTKGNQPFAGNALHAHFADPSCRCGGPRCGSRFSGLAERADRRTT